VLKNILFPQTILFKFYLTDSFLDHNRQDHQVVNACIFCAEGLSLNPGPVK